MADRLNIDFETRSTLELAGKGGVGAYAYAEHESTDLWCACYSFDDEEEVYVWVPGQPCPERIREHVKVGGEIRAWNAQFERVIWWLILYRRYDWPKPELEQFHCTMADAIAMSLPRALGQAAKAVNLSEQKQDQKLVKQMAKPRSTKGGEVVWWDLPEKIAALIDYCQQDVRTERAMFRRTRRLLDFEREVWLETERMNDRGVLIDVPLVKAGKKLASHIRDEAGDMISDLTEGAVTKVTQYVRLKAWLLDNNIHVKDTTKATVRDLLADHGVQGPVRRVLEIWSETAKASIRKLDAMLRMRNSDGVCRGLQIYHGASTGRWSGSGFQPHNFPRPDIEDPQQYIPAILDGETEFDEPPVIVLTNLLRGMIRARPGRRLLVADYAQIEYRVLCWIAQQEDMLRLLLSGQKPYPRMTSKIYGMPEEDVTKDLPEYTVGKTAVLGCGYQMGPEKFSKQLYKETGILLEARSKLDEPPGPADEAVWAYRDLHYKVVEFWGAIEAAARLALLRPGRVTRYGRGSRIRFVKRGKFLWCILPSGRPLGYCQPSIERTETKVGVREQIKYMTRDPMSKKWVRTSTYGGKLTENVVQAMARDLLAHGLMNAARAGYPNVLTVHDELVADVPDDFGSLDEFNALMSDKPQWAASCPVEVEGFEAERYRK